MDDAARDTLINVLAENRQLKRNLDVVITLAQCLQETCALQGRPLVTLPIERGMPGEVVDQLMTEGQTALVLARQQAKLDEAAKMVAEEATKQAEAERTKPLAEEQATRESASKTLVPANGASSTKRA